MNNPFRVPENYTPIQKEAFKIKRLRLIRKLELLLLGVNIFIFVSFSLFCLYCYVALPHYTLSFEMPLPNWYKDLWLTYALAAGNGFLAAHFYYSSDDTARKISEHSRALRSFKLEAQL